MLRSRPGSNWQRCWAVVLGAAAMVSMSPCAFGQQTQLVEVTGTRLLRPELFGNTPTLAVSAESLAALGIENFADMATQLPQFAPAFGVSRTQSTQSSPQNTGLNLVNLRNLGFSRALVLINGRRTVGGTATTSAVDFNTIPMANIERIDIITGGASAVYGSDAISGVINIITRKKFEGWELGAGLGVTHKGDNENPTAHVLWGRNFGDAGRVLATLQVDHQGRVSCRDRELCAEDFSWTLATLNSPLRGPPAYSQVGLGGRFFVGGTSYVRRNNSFVDTNGQLMPFVLAIDGYPASAERDLAIPTRRTMAAIEAEFALGSSMRGYGELNYGKSEITSRFESFGFQSTDTRSLYGTLQPTIPIDNPFMPAPLRAAVNTFNATAPAAQRISALTWFRRLDFAGSRGATNAHESTRAVLGLKGDFRLFGQDWRWDAYHVEGRAVDRIHANGLISTANIYHGLRVEQDPAGPGRYRCADAAARAAGCVPFNPFGDITAEMQDALHVNSDSYGKGTLANTVVSVSGVLAELPAGSLRVAAGLERRRISGYFDVASVTNNGHATGTPIADIDLAVLTTHEAFMEALIPVLADVPGARSLNVETALRRSVADRWGYNTWRIGGDWEPMQGLRVRAMRSRAVRAPEPRDLSGGGTVSPSTINDPCTSSRRDSNPTRAANCAADGVPTSYNPVAAAAVIGGAGATNPGLTPELGTTITMGVVWEPSQLKGLSVAVDRFKIDVQGIIGALGRQIAADRCYDTADRQFCASVHRGTHPLVPGASYVLTGVDQRLENIAAQSVAGVDVDIKYRWKTAQGSWEAGLMLTRYDKAVLVPNAISEPVELLGKAGGLPSGVIRLTGTARVGARIGDLKADWSLRYIGSTDMALGLTEQGFPRIPATTYQNIRLVYAFAANAEASFGITNLANKKPPVFATGSSGTPSPDTIPGYYDIFGRSFFAGVKWRWH